MKLIQSKVKGMDPQESIKDNYFSIVFIYITSYFDLIEMSSFKVALSTLIDLENVP